MMPKEIYPATYDLTCSDVFNLTVGTVMSHLEIPVRRGEKYVAPRDVFSMLVGVCAGRTSANAFAGSCCFKAPPSAWSFMYHLKKIGVSEAEEAVNRMLQERFVLDRTVPKGKKHAFAVDLHLIPYHGWPLKEGKEVRRSRAKRGTTHFHAYASIYLVLEGRRYTLAVKYVTADTTLVEVLDFLIGQVEGGWLGYRVGKLYLDREFFRVEVINYLKKRDIWFLMPAVLRGRSGGMRKLLKGVRKSYKTSYTMTSPRRKNDRGGGRMMMMEKVTFDVFVVVKYGGKKKYKGKKQGRNYFVYAYYGNSFKLGKAFEEYRLRFGVESSYRQMNETRGRTSTKNPAVRLLYVGVSFLLRNLWIYLQWSYLAVKTRKGRGRGGRKILEDEFRYRKMIEMIKQTLNDLFGTIRKIRTTQPIKIEKGVKTL